MRVKMPIIKLPNGAYFMWTLEEGMNPQDLLFAMQGVRSKDKTLVMPYSVSRYNGMFGIKNYLVEKGLVNLDRIIFLYHGEGEIRQSRLRGCYTDAGHGLKDITKSVLLYDLNKWIVSSKVESWQMEWLSNVMNQMIRDNRFLLGQMEDRLKLNDWKQRITEMNISLEKKEEELKNMKSVDDIKKSCVDNILKMKWIDKIETGPNNGLRILTKPMACTYVPNIGRYIPYDFFKRSDVLYRMMKYQALGKYFIILPDYYIIESNFHIKGDDNNRYPLSHVRNVAIRNTYFHGQACHIGNGQSCLGELSTAISQAGKTGLDMLLMSFEVYLRSINLPDAAGQRYYCLPMGDADGNIEVWPYVEGMMKKEGVSFKGEERTLEAYEKILSETKLAGLSENFGKYFDGSCESWGDQRQEENMKKCLELIKEREPEVYDKIQLRIKEGAVV